MRLGAVYPGMEVPADPDVIRRFVAAIEELGFTHVMAPDHVIKAQQRDRDPPLTGPYTEKDAFSDPFVLFSFMAALTDKLDFVTGVLVLPQRQTALVAQQAADVDLLSRERLRLGVGIGWNHVEYVALGQDFRTRGRRIEEQIALLRQLWTQDLVSFEGSFDRLERACINPRPRRSIPLWLGGHSEAAYERGARIGDGFVYANGPGAPEALARVREHLTAFGRRQPEFGNELLTQFARNATEAAGELKRWRDLDGTHGAVPSTGKGLGPDIEAHIGYFAEVIKQIAQ